ncbi:MAG: glucose-6-phosphate dehydrogenase [Planctomycetes bacterium]|nr:glucose-6-phosphate dehydrogenase [Planctomycetota bacterium]
MTPTFVIFGASGDLTSRKLIPALYSLFRKGRMPDGLRVIGFSRTEFSHDQWRTALAESTQKFLKTEFDNASWAKFAAGVFYHAGDIEQPADFAALEKAMPTYGEKPGDARIYYLATAPRFYEPAIEHLGSANMAAETNGERRIIIEKPFGTDLESAKKLNVAVHRVFNEEQVYRIDHYLGKETVQNLLVLRFANTIFEPIWNRNYIDHVQITVAEEVTVGRRGGYYETAGILRDMFQNHLLQLMMVTAMEVPVRFQADLVRDEKVKVLQAVRTLTPAQIAETTLRGQYRGYLQEPGVAPNSRTATFGAVKLYIDNWRWQGVPFYLRSGKAMSCRTTQIVVQFREPPHMMFSNCKGDQVDSNRLVVQVQPAEGLQLHFQTKVPDAGMHLTTSDLEFRFSKQFGPIPDAYQPLLLDALEGDASLFARHDEVEAAWSIIDPIIQDWANSDRPPLYVYEPAMWGPEESVAWMQAQKRQWFDTCPVLGPHS